MMKAIGPVSLQESSDDGNGMAESRHDQDLHFFVKTWLAFLENKLIIYLPVIFSLRSLIVSRFVRMNL
jgi:hypothetical protein